MWGRPSKSEMLGPLRGTDVDWSLWYWPRGDHRNTRDERLRMLRYKQRAPLPAADVPRRVMQVRIQLVIGAF